MDTETIITLIIVAIGILWNLIAKMREKMTLPESAPPWSGQEEPAEMYEEDLSPYTVIEDEESTLPIPKSESFQEDSFLLSGMMPKKDIPVSKSIYDSGQRKRRLKCKGISRSKLKEAIIWSEILAPPLSLR